MTILFVLPYDTTYRYRAAFLPALSYQPLTLAHLAALVPADWNAEMTLVDEGVRPFDYTKGHYDLVCISAATSAAPRGYQLARVLRERGSYIAMGGHHATLLPEEVLDHADTVLTGTAEVTFPAFLADFAAGTPQRRYDAQSFFPGRVPLPRRDLMPTKGYLKQPTLIADYGCPNRCGYCVIHPFWGGASRRPVGDVLDEIRLLNTKEILLLDPSPFTDRAYAYQLLEGFAAMGIQWAGLAALDVAQDQALLPLLQKSGCVGLLLGFESFTQGDLDSAGKYKNKVSEYAGAVEGLHQHGIAVLGTFMLGMDGDTPEALAELPALIAGTKIDVPRFAIVTPWPGTPFFQELEDQGRILHRDWRRYDTVHCVFRPRHMTPEQLEASFLSVWRRCYTPNRIRRRLSHTPQRKLTALVTNVGFRIYAMRLKDLL